jgi:hypothetical protein
MNVPFPTGTKVDYTFKGETKTAIVRDDIQSFVPGSKLRKLEFLNGTTKMIHICYLEETK